MCYFQHHGAEVRKTSANKRSMVQLANVMTLVYVGDVKPEFDACAPTLISTDLGDVELAAFFCRHLIELKINETLAEGEESEKFLLDFTEAMLKAWEVPEECTLTKQCGHVLHATKRAFKLIQMAAYKTLTPDTSLKVFDDIKLLLGGSLKAESAADVWAALRLAHASSPYWSSAFGDLAKRADRMKETAPLVQRLYETLGKMASGPSIDVVKVVAKVVADLPELLATAGGGLEELEAKAVAIVAEHAAAVATKLLEQPSGCRGGGGGERTSSSRGWRPSTASG